MAAGRARGVARGLRRGLSSAAALGAIGLLGSGQAAYALAAASAGGTAAVLPGTAQPALAQPSAARPPQATAYEWVTLGTHGGPMPSLKRSQPANLLVRNGEAHLIDVGDGAASRMVAAGAGYPWLRSIFISHIHPDHIGGLFAVLSLRQQTRVTRPLTIYGPPGTREIVNGLVAALKPSAESGFGVPGEVPIKPGENLSVVELADGATAKLDGLTVKAAANSHYSFAPGSEQANRFKSLSYRFDLPGRSIVYTGDTGPSTAVEQLARGADVLVTEMIDLAATVENVKRRAAYVSPQEQEQMVKHLSTHHLTTDDVGKLAQRAGVKKVVVTHLAGGGANDPGAADRYVAEIQRRFKGPVVVANDLDRF